MIVALKREDLITLVRGSSPNDNAFDEPLVKLAGLYYDQYSRTYWNFLDKLSDEELYELYNICKNSWKIKNG